MASEIRRLSSLGQVRDPLDWLSRAVKCGHVLAGVKAKPFQWPERGMVWAQGSGWGQGLDR